jgi:hypothetical protein
MPRTLSEQIMNTDGADPAELILLQDITATAAEINSAADVSSKVVSISDATTYTVLAADSGKTHLVPDLTADITISLPAVASGLEYTFVYSGNAIELQDWIIDTGSDTNFYLGGLLYVDDAPAANSVIGDGNSNSILTVLVPEGGTRVSVVCDGTNWILSGVVASASAPTFADQS